MMDKIWLKHYPPGVPAQIDPARYSSVVALLEDSFATHRDRQAFICMGKAITYGELDDMSRIMAAWLQSLGLARGARVAVMMPNVLQYPVALAAILRAGFTAVTINPLYTPRELEHQLRDSGAEAIVVLENFAHTLTAVIGRTAVKHVVVATMGDMLGLKGVLVNLVVRHVKKMVPPYSLPGALTFNRMLAAGRKLPFTPAAITPEDVAFLQYTGGTTGVAKGATLLHRNIVAQVLQAEAWLRPSLMREPRIDPLIMLGALPLYHIFALTACGVLGMKLGATCLLIPNPRDIPSLIKDLAKYPVACLPAVNTLFSALLNHPDFGTISWSNLRCAMGGGMAVQRPVAEAWKRATGQPIIEAYGLSETSPGLTINRPDITDYTGTIGLPLPSTDIAIRDSNDVDMPLGEAGEICARGPQVMAGYWQRPDETAKVMSPDGFFRTGDIGIMLPDGQIRIIDRKKDMILVSGFNVYPNEVEGVIAEHPDVLECAVIGVPDPHSGEAVKLFVVSRNPKLTADELKTFARTRLTSYKVPHQIEFRTDLPKSNVGKILRRALRDEPQTPKDRAA